MSRRRVEAGRRRHGGTLSTTASEAPCRACRRPLLYAWDEGVLVKANREAVDLPVANALRAAGRVVYVLTEGRWLVRETAERAGTLRLVASRHPEHVCPSEPVSAPVVHKQLEIFDHGTGGSW